MIALVACLWVGAPQDGELRVSQPRASAASEFPAGTELRLHDASRTTGHARLDELMLELGQASALDALAAAAALERVAGRRAQVESVTQGLVETLRDRMQPPLVPPQRLESLGDGRVALLGTPEQHAWLDGFLAAAVAFDGLIDIQTRIYEVPRDVLPAGFAARSGQTLAPREGMELVTLLAQQSVEATLAPRLTAFPFQESNLAVVEQIPYVRDFEIKVMPDQAEIADPVVDVAEDGARLDVRAVATGARQLLVYARLDYARVARPIANLSLDLGRGRSFTVQKPEITHVKVDGHFELDPEQVLLFVTPVDSGAKYVLVLLQARRVPAQPEERR